MAWNSIPDRVAEDSWKIALATGAIVLVMLGIYLANGFWKGEIGGERWKQELIKNYPAIGGIPLAAVGAFGLVIFFDLVKEGDVTIKLLGFEIAGPAGPIFRWAIVFLCMVVSISVLYRR